MEGQKRILVSGVNPISPSDIVCSISSARCLTLIVVTWADTQKDQDAADDEARQQANKDLVQSWMDRLQLISVIVSKLREGTAPWFIDLVRCAS